MYNDGYSSTGTGFDLFFAVIYFFIVLAITLVTYVINALLLMQIFRKAGVPQWVAWVPFYNHWKILELGGQQGFWAILVIIPIVNIVSEIFTYIALFHIGKKLGKHGTFVLWAIFIPIVWYIWLAVDKSKWGDKYVPATN